MLYFYYLCLKLLNEIRVVQVEKCIFTIILKKLIIDK